MQPKPFTALGVGSLSIFPNTCFQNTREWLDTLWYDCKLEQQGDIWAFELLA
jgi:hypothetical protein